MERIARSSIATERPKKRILALYVNGATFCLIEEGKARLGMNRSEFIRYCILSCFDVTLREALSGAGGPPASSTPPASSPKDAPARGGSTP